MKKILFIFAVSILIYSNCFCNEIVDIDSFTVVNLGEKMDSWNNELILPCNSSQNWKIWLTISSGTKSQGIDLITDNNIFNKVTKGTSFRTNWNIKTRKINE